MSHAKPPRVTHALVAAFTAIKVCIQGDVILQFQFDLDLSEIQLYEFSRKFKTRAPITDFLKSTVLYKFRSIVYYSFNHLLLI